MTCVKGVLSFPHSVADVQVKCITQNVRGSREAKNNPKSSKTLSFFSCKIAITVKYWPSHTRLAEAFP